jgi:diketogulonate reductase-like aldo/keto reductase
MTDEHQLRPTRREVLAAIAGGLAAAALPAAARGEDRTIRREIPGTGLRLPVVGLGTARQFDVDPADAATMADLAEVLAVTASVGGLVDTSPMYGRAEAVLGRLMAAGDLRDDLFIATKVWTRGREEGIEQMRRSMSLMGVGRVELMQVHNLVDTDAHLRTLRRWREEGLVDYLGITHYRVDAHDDLAAVIEREPLDFVQLNYSLLTPDAEDRLLPLAADRGVAVLVNRPYENGEVFARVAGREVPPWAVEAGMPTWGQFFLKWILAHPAVTVAIPATSRPRHARDNLAAAEGELPDAGLRRRMREHVLAL